ncbi:MAG: hypothetical protein LUQ54_05270, partial [Methanoregula sp.]|nr:hypothetical protein [Methanoregula sp.]
LELARDKPDLYGGDVAKNAFFMFLLHVYNSRKEDFPKIIASLLNCFPGRYQSPPVLSAIKDDLIRLGYPEKEVETAFSCSIIYP